MFLTKIKDLILNNRIVQLSLTLVLGIAIGAIFYPTKSIREEESAKYQQQIATIQSEHSKEIKEIDTKYTLDVKMLSQKNEDIKSLYEKSRTENIELRQKMKKRTVKITKPDGTIIETILEESESETISKITDDLKQSYESKLQEQQATLTKESNDKQEKIKTEYESQLKQKTETIQTYERQFSEDINKKSFGISAGYMLNKSYFGSVQKDIFGPVFLDVTGVSNLKDEYNVGAGIGLRF
jgi:uncharacterized membrane-anchored protein YhcB (DUF1043 family)